MRDPQRILRHLLAFLGLILVGPSPARVVAGEPPTDEPAEIWSPPVRAAIEQAGPNRTEWLKALESVSPQHRVSLEFLLEHMPTPDLQSLTAAYVIEHIELAHAAWENAPWRGEIPLDLFLNDVLPYACLNEKRDSWRKPLLELCRPLVQDCTTASKAAEELNRKLFGLVNVRYSTQRRRADQSPLESMESGMATCTGLSILLVDACRAVGVPARVVGTPSWVNKRGNHTWVEIWDGDWHFLGAAEPDPNGLDRGWFVQDAAQALRDSPRHAIYAGSYRKTGLAFPLVWARNIEWVSAVNVTDRYAKAPSAESANTTRLLLKVLDRPAGRRVAAKVRVTDPEDSSVHLEGVSRDESADLNDLLSFDLKQRHTYEIRAEHADLAVERTVNTSTNAQESLLLCLDLTPAFLDHPLPPYPAPQTSVPLKDSEKAQLSKELSAFITAPPDDQAAWNFPRALDELLLDREPAVRAAAWEVFRESSIGGALQQDFNARQVQFEGHLSPYTLKTVGTRPAQGWPLFIAMHGGGGAPKRVNDSQWRVMQQYYRDHPELGGYLYLALRAPNDTWNGFYDVYVYPLVANLIRQFLVFGDVDPNKVFLMGYSHGGYGAFAIGPKIPDRFAAIHASAAAPTDGETTAATLRNTLFTYMIGERDTSYGRIERCRRFRDSVAELRGDRSDIYPVFMQYIPGNGHSGLPDRDKIIEMYGAQRNPVPRELSWLMTDSVVRDFFWLHTSTPSKAQRIEALCRDNRIALRLSPEVAPLTVLLDQRLVDFDRPVVLEVNGQSFSRTIRPTMKTFATTLLRRGDPELAFSAQIELDEQAIQQAQSVK